MLDVGPSPSDVDGLVMFVDRLGAAGTDGAAARAHRRVGEAIAAGAAPPGLRRLAEGLSGTNAGALPPPPRRPSGDPGSVVTAVRDDALIVLDEVEPDEIAGAVAALVDDGRRVIVTGPQAAALDAVRAALPTSVRARVVDALPTLAPAELHRLRGLLVTSTPGRRARTAQRLPELTALPDPAEVAELCAVLERPTAPGTEQLVPLLSAVDPERHAAVTALARSVQRALATLAERGEPWMWDLLADLVHGRRRPAFDSLVQSAAQALGTLDDGRDDPPVRITGPLPARAVDTLVAYLEFLQAGGRSRGPFRSALQRDVAPVLRQLRVGGRPPESADDLRFVLTHFELREKLHAVDADCAGLDLPTPQNATELRRLADALNDIGTAARAVSALRHDMLFLGDGAPVAVPDVAAAERLALAVVDYAENGSATEAAQRLDTLADALAALAPPAATAPEHARAVDALRSRRAAEYVAAVEDLVRAHRELRDERRTLALLAALGSPSLAAAWDVGREPGPAARGGPAARFGFAWFRPTAQLLEELPGADEADVVVVLDAARQGVDRALLAAAAPRMVATVAPGSRWSSGTLLGLLQRASALVIRGRAVPSTGRVVPLPPGPRPLPVTGHDGVEQAGA
jgi:hypothetical protein